MDTHIDRRAFLKASAVAAGGATLASGTASRAQVPTAASPSAKPIRLGFVGIGGRGTYHLDCALGMEGVEIPALCEIREDRLQNAKKMVEESGRGEPTLYGRGETDFQRMCETEALDAVICSTSWKWHTPVCLAAMRSDKHAVSEVPIVLTVDEAWELIETFEKTKKWATLALEQVLLESSDGMNLAVLNMIKEGVLGEIIHAEGGYIHDLRLVMHDPEEEPWRLWHSIHRNGNLYPDHPMNTVMPYLDVNHGDRFDFLMSMSTRSGMLNEFAKTYYSPDHPNVTLEMKQGDYNATILRTVDGKVVTLNHDTHTPHPRGIVRVQGSKGVFMNGRGLDGPKIYLDGISPEEHEWEDATPYLQEYQHPLIKAYDPPERTAIRGHGSGARRTPLTWSLLVEALRRDEMPYFDVYDSVTSSVISPLTEKSVANRSKPVDFPDFTRGKWQSRPRLDLFNFVAYV
ncbi:MAG: twin-arginine translocation signal domain-containing protein [Luteitalea sp.]|nr:twin-arginine translocation signal domain-containing protein [Luteitalea sp.]